RHAGKLAARTDLGDGDGDSGRLVLFDTNAARAGDLADHLGVLSARSYEELLAATDAVVIAAPTVAHAELGIRALRAGRHVLVEKPIAVTLTEADALLSAARAASRTLMVGHIERFNPAVRQLEGRLTAPRFIEGHRLAEYQPRSLDIDVILDLMIHDIDLVLHLIRELPSRIDAAGTPVLSGKIDIANARLSFPGGAVANLTASRVSLTRTRKIRFFMPETYVSIDLAARGAQFYRLKGAMGEPVADAEAFLARLSHESFVDDGRDQLEAEHSAFLAAARGEAPNPIPGEDGRAALAVAMEVIGRLAEREG
ncbi:MAG: Gfo/Idh/MocA family oxidoreductase, partial [Candidatus Eisenbacteria bacterium]|nr:Gfo/Idh/MocA family oxidoreductase [Candidatus Eisenbacteria bacterium]